MNTKLETVSKTVQRPRLVQPRLATLCLFAIVIGGAAVVALWFAGVGEIEMIFAYLNGLQERPPMWVEAPMVMTQFLLTPTVVLFLLTLLIIKISPQPLTWSRTLIVVILLILLPSLSAVAFVIYS